MTKAKSAQLDRFALFTALLILTLFLWFLYRGLFSFPVWFDETVGKALFFGLPVLIFVNMTQAKYVLETFALNRARVGLLRGLAVGGLFGFAAVLTAAFSRGVDFTQAPLFVVDRFWWELLLALLTSLWESLFFFGFMQQVIKNEASELSWLMRVILIAAIFLVFHIPNSILRFSGVEILYQLFILGLFGLGQAMISDSYPNIYTLALTQTIWGMILLVHF
ncbi:MAG: hypothetical protein GF381_02775 [Candidatus Pacebacteria bacterium]|nr:hypothetical protein [Candidatus Paceibacterota bacterium]